MRQPLVFTTVRSRREDREFQRYNKPEEPEDQPRPVEGRRQELLKKFQWHLFTSPEGLLSEWDWKDAEDRMKWARKRAVALGLGAARLALGGVGQPTPTARPAARARRPTGSSSRRRRAERGRSSSGGGDA
jgi:hypothetical protein